MAGQIKCPQCGQTYGLTDEQVPQYAGQTITCSKCGRGFTLPPSDIEPAAPDGSEQPRRIEPIDYANPDRQPKRFNDLAVLSVLCAMLGFLVPIIPSLIAVVAGIMGLRRSRHSRTGKGVAITGIALGAIVLLIYGMAFVGNVGWTLRPTSGRQVANRVYCAGNMRSIGQAMQLYAHDNGGAYPMQVGALVTSAYLSAQCFICPASTSTPAQGPATGSPPAYAYFGAGLNTSASANTVLLCEPLANHNNEGINVLFGDWHVEYIPRQQAQQLLVQLQAGTNPPK